MQTTQDPAVSVIIATRDRPDDCQRAVQSVVRDLEGRPGAPPTTPEVEVLVVDQSAGDATRRRIEELGSPLVRQVTMAGAEGPHVGASAARNRGAALARGELLLFIDDDVEVLPGWFAGWRRVVDAHPACAVFFGEVLPCGSLPANAFVAAFEVPEPRVWGPEVLRHGFDRVGLSANMALRKRDYAALHGLDACLGAGSELRGSEELDLGYRVVASGRRLVHAPGTPVLHHGFRVGADAARLTSGYQFSIGAMLAKHARLGDARALGLLVRWGGRLFSKVVRGVLGGRRPLGARDLLAYLHGIRVSFRYRVDRTTALYRPRAGVAGQGGGGMA